MKEILTRDFLLVSCAQFAFAFVGNILVPTLPIYLSSRGAGEVEIGLLIGSLSVSALILRPIVGRALTKIAEKKFMIWGALLFALTSLAYIVAPPFWPLLAVRFLQGVGLALYHTAAYTFVANITSPARRGQAMSYFVLSFNVACAVAPPLGIVLVDHYGFTILFLVCAGLSSCSLFLSFTLRKPDVAPPPNLPVGAGSFFSRKALPPSIANSLTYLTWGSLTTFFPLYAVECGAANPGLFFSTFAAMLILGRTLGAWIMDRYSKERLILPCLFLCALSLAVLAFSRTMPMFIVAAIIMGAGFTFLMPSLLVIAIERAQPHPGLAMGTFTAVADMGLVLGPVMTGMIISGTSYSTAFLGLALIEVFTIGYFQFSVGKNRQEGYDRRQEGKGSTVAGGPFNG